jgi:preprotein translocase subunit SecD
MNRYPVWKRLTVLIVLVISAIYATPNLFRPDPALQISGESGGQVIDEAVKQKAEAALTAANIPIKAVDDSDPRTLLIRLENSNDQLTAKKVVESILPVGFIVALNLASTTPEWLHNLGADPMKLGLDLSGGVHFLLEVDTDFSLNKRLEGYRTEIQKKLRESRIRGIVTMKDDEISAKFASEDDRKQALKALKQVVPELEQQTYEADGDAFVVWRFGDALKRKIASDSVSQNLVALRNRVDELGVSEPLVQRQGLNRIVVELPGVQDSAVAKRIIGKTANLEFRLEARGDTAGETFQFRNPEGYKKSAQLERSYVITGDQVANANTSFDENSRPQVNITLDSQGGRQMHNATKTNIGRNLGVLFIERKTRNETRMNEQGEKEIVRVPYYEKQIISLATIQSALGVQFRITGLNSPYEARELALLLRAGSLAAPVDFVQERTIGPSSGEQNIAKGINAIIWAMAAVLVFMLFYYKVFGIFANLALLMNLVVLVSVMSIISATLTLPGIAGIVLTLGMAVDANVLIFERIKEELRDGLAPARAISAGYDRAFVTILDSNLTTLLVALILYALGTGPIKGFAVTLGIGILTSMFTAIVGTRTLVELVYGNRNVKKLAI